MEILDKYSDELNVFCKAKRIKKLSLFGSYLSNSFNEESDIDLLAEFEKDTGYAFT